MAFLYDILSREFGTKAIAEVPVPSHITNNLKPVFGLRPYQQEAFQRFVLCHSRKFEGKPGTPLHLLFNMATGSGKTLVMAGLMLHLYARGYRHFLFFVNSNNIIQKTKDNFLNPAASKYLFNRQIVINGQNIPVKEVANFEEAGSQQINIKFTTIQQLHTDLHHVRENSMALEDFRYGKTVLIADEAHHLSSATRGKGALPGSWEGTVLQILQQHPGNLLLEFTATLDYENREIVQKYQDKVVFRYDLSRFRADGYSKEINLVRSHYNEQERVLQALVLNLYRQELAASRNIDLKPVILFKAKKTIKESEQNKENFHLLIERLSADMLRRIQQTSTLPVVQRAFRFFKARGTSRHALARLMQAAFSPENCLSANNDAEADHNQLLLNTLEDSNNPVRAVFAVQKLNEGWDVLNLFDIVRLYDERDGKGGKPGKTTLSEAQLIGRGARYCPFALEPGQDRFTRKFDRDPGNDLKILEELCYHTREDSRYIAELKKALVASGIYQEKTPGSVQQRSLKTAFRESDFYHHGQVLVNTRAAGPRKSLQSLAGLGIKPFAYRHVLASGVGQVSGAFHLLEHPPADRETLKTRQVPLSEMPGHLIRYALSRHPFFYFDNLLRYFPQLGSLSAFIEQPEFLGSMGVAFRGTNKRLAKTTPKDCLQAVEGLLQQLEAQIKAGASTCHGTGFTPLPFCQVFGDRDVRAGNPNKTAQKLEAVLAAAPWYVYDGPGSTEATRHFARQFARCLPALQQRFGQVYLVSNERQLRVYDWYGRGLYPDFILFCRQPGGEQINFQVLIELQGESPASDSDSKTAFLHALHTSPEIVETPAGTVALAALALRGDENEDELLASLLNSLKQY